MFLATEELLIYHYYSLHKSGMGTTNFVKNFHLKWQWKERKWKQSGSIRANFVVTQRCVDSMLRSVCLCLVFRNTWWFKALLASGLGTKAWAVCWLQTMESLLCFLPHILIVRPIEQCHIHFQQKRLVLKHEWQAAQPVVSLYISLCQSICGSMFMSKRPADVAKKQLVAFSWASLTPL